MSKNFNKYPVRMCLVLHIHTHYKGQGVLVVYATMSCCVCTKVEANLCVWRLWCMMNSGGQIPCAGNFEAYDLHSYAEFS